MTVLNLRIFCLLGLSALALSYDIGITNHYDYETVVAISEKCGDVPKIDPFGNSLRAKIQLTAVWQNPQNAGEKLMKIQLSQPKLFVSKKSVFEEQQSGLEKAPTSDSFFLIKDSKVEKFWDDPKDHSVLRNLKRSVASLLQVVRKDGEQKMDDVSGECRVFYKTEKNTVRRSKSGCRHPVDESVAAQLSGVRSSAVQHSAGIDCDLKDDVSGIVSQCLVTEQLKTHSNLWKKASICTQSRSSFTFEKSTESKKNYKHSDYRKVIEELDKKDRLVEGSLFAVYDIKDEQIKSNVFDSSKSFQDSLKANNLAKLKSASAFFKLLPIFRSASKEDLLKVLKNRKFEIVLPQILDLVAASSTPSSVGAALAFFEKVKDYDPNLERYLISLSVLPSPESYILKEIKNFLEKGGHHEKIESTLATTLGSLLRSYVQSGKADLKVSDEVLGYLEEALKKCETDVCTLSYLRGLRNAAQLKSTPILSQYALKGGKPSLEAVLAIKNMRLESLSQELQQLLQKVFHQVGAKQDRSTRAIAAEILLRGNPDDDVLKSVLRKLSDQTDEEFNSFVVSKILHLMDEHKTFRSKMLKILQEKEVSHYYSLSQKGKSSLFKRQLMSADGINATYGIAMELLEGGLLKRSSFDVELETDIEVTNLLSVAMFAEGLGSIAGESTSEEEGEGPLAGMELTLLGSSLRPYVFFSSTSELMGHAWSGTASEPTPALQGIFLLNDDRKFVVLHNGMVAKLELRSVMSTDLSASIQISLWNRNSQSQVKNAAAFLVKGSAVVDMDFAKTRGEYHFYGQSSIDFSSELEFGESPFKMCFQMEHPDIVLKHDFQRSVAAEKFSSKKTKRRKKFIPSRSYALGLNNNELCRIMKTSDYYY